MALCACLLVQAPHALWHAVALTLDTHTRKHLLDPLVDSRSLTRAARLTHAPPVPPLPQVPPRPHHSNIMHNKVVLARVSLRDNLLCVCDPRGVIVFASDDLLWALGLPGPTSATIGASLLDLLTEEDKLEYKVCVGRDGVGWKGSVEGTCRANRCCQRGAVDLLLDSPAGGPGRDFILPLVFCLWDLVLIPHPSLAPSPHSQNAMRRKSGSLLRCQQNGCFVWLDIQSSGQTSRLKRALQRVEQARATCSSLLHPACHSEHNNNHHHHEPSPPSTTSTSTINNNNSPLNHQSKALATASFSCAGGAGRIAGLEEHVLTKEQTLDWFLSTRDQDEGMDELADDENDDDDDDDDDNTDTATEGSDSEGDEADEVAFPRPLPMAPARLVESAALPPLGGLSLHESGSECNSACTTSSSACSSEQLSGPGATGWTEEEQQRQQQEEAAMVREYSFREIFEYLSAGAKGMSQSTSFCRGGSRASSVLNFGSTAAAAAPSSPAATLVRSAHPQRDSRPFSERMAAKCRAAPEESYSASSYSFTPVASSSSSASSSSWLLQNKYKVSGYVGKAAATLGLGTVVSSTAAAAGPPLMTAPPMLEESGWDWYVDV